MALIGIDFGNDSCYVAIPKIKGAHTIDNDYSQRCTPSCVAFSEKNRILGVAAKNQIVMNLKNTVYGFKRLLGRKFLDPHVQNELKYLPYKVEPTQDGGVGIRVHYRGEDNVYSPEQLTAMLFTKLKNTTITSIERDIKSCVISVPSYFTNAERHALLDAATIAGLNVLCILNDTSAIALTYAMSKDDFPACEESPRNVVFVDFGHSGLQVAACAFNKGKVRVLATSTDHTCGGRDFDMALATHFCDEFISKMNLDARKNHRVGLRLLQEAEKLKKQMSVNSSSLAFNVESFMQGLDVTSKMQRSQMEQICADIFNRVEATLRAILKNAKLRPEDIHSVEMVGGSTRIPAVKTLIKQVFGKLPFTSMNQDEAVSLGCALHCAMQTPGTNCIQFAVTDVQPYPVRIAWDKPAGEAELYSIFYAAPSSKLLTFDRHEPFTLSAYYSEQVPYPEACIGQWHIRGVKQFLGLPQQVKLKIRINASGIITLEIAGKNGEGLQIDTQTHGLSLYTLEQCIDTERRMQAAEQREKERVDACNALEYYVFELRRNLIKCDLPTASRLVPILDAVELWLESDGKHLDKQAFVDKLAELRREGEASSGPHNNNQRSTEQNTTAGQSTGTNERVKLTANRRNPTSHERNTSLFNGSQASKQTSTSDVDMSDEKEMEHIIYMTGLNKWAVEHITKQIEQNPSFNLLPVFKKYENFLKKFNEENQ